MATIDIQNGAVQAVSSGNDYRLAIAPGSSATTQIVAPSSLTFTLHASQDGENESDMVPGGHNGTACGNGTIYGTDTGALADGDLVDAVPGNVVYLIFRVTGGTGSIVPLVGSGLKVLA